MNERMIFMYGVSKISSEQNIMLTTFPGAQYSAQSLAEHLDVFAKAGIVVDMICQSAPRGSAVDFSFTTSYDNFAAVMKALPAAAKANPPLVSGGYSKINLFGEEMVTSCGVAARALAALAGAGIEIVLITTSDLDISLLIRQHCLLYTSLSSCSARGESRERVLRRRKCAARIFWVRSRTGAGLSRCKTVCCAVLYAI